MTGRLFIALPLCFLSALSAADFAPVFTSGAVLQRDEPLVIWGTGRDGESVIIELLDKSAGSTVKNGRWSVILPAVPATASTTLRLRGDETVELTDIAIGEVWICAGQSNMEWRLNQCPPYADDLLANAGNAAIRQLKIPLRCYEGDPLPKFSWVPFDRANAPFFSVVAYYFAADLQRRLGVPVGIVNCSYGGTPIEAWMSREALAGAGFGDLLAEDVHKSAAFADPAAYDRAWNEYQTARKAWDAGKKANPSDPALGPQPVEPYGVRTKSRPGGVCEAMLALIIPYTARGILWYQGENNAGRPAEYARALPCLMAAFRADWNKPGLPIFLGQLSSPTANWPDEKEGYAALRDVQRAVALADPYSGFVVTLDHGERGNVHPVNKQPVGERFARLARARVYGEKGLAAQSPSAAAARLAGGRIQVAFVDLPGRLVPGSSSISALEVQVTSGEWRPAAAELSADGRSLLVTPPDDTPPRAVRYAYRNFCELSLFSDEGLPVSPWNLPLAP